ncbi:hypothetical protein GCM10027275_17650 [Rhabdobacter roseus]|uniref:Enterochelin esterase-like enzyme n=1 Tax=Rhabdobacter roseus TaxID=1655419 RepID=A0A840TUF7_9BACT|nr:PHB depolymerase family esterase [Rhabdobacter roseus]MBB5283688.1 enterochelin esterase-like enzyme [Rhabdobacter roseus]
MLKFSFKAWQVSLVLWLLALSPATRAQQLPAGPQVLTFYSDVDDTEQPYGLYLPKNYNPKKKYPLVVMLHGAGSNHRLALKRVFGKTNLPGETDVETSRYFPAWRDVDYIVASAYARGTMGYQGIAEKDVLDMVADVKRRFSVDEDRTYLTGLSMGGGGTMWIGLSYPDMWAAIAPVCPAPPQGTLPRVPNALHVPMHFFQGDADPAVKVDSTRQWVQRLKDAGTNVTYVEYPGVGHDSWENAYKDGFIFDWFSQFRRNPHPDRVRFASTQYRHGKAYWVVLDEFTPGRTASIEASFTAANRIEVQAKDLSAFTLNLAGHPKFKAGKPLEVVVNGQSVRTQTQGTLSLSERGGTWAEGKPAVGTLSKKAGTEGPLSEALASRHVYVYGTGGNPTPEELNRRRSVAGQAAEWSGYRGEFLGRVMVFPRLLSDQEVRPSDLESANLILFGTKETNSLIGRFADQLPLELSTSATDYGLAYVFPHGSRYVLINSGLPWWTEPASPGGAGYRFATGPVNSIGRFGDFILFKGNYANVVAEGRFDQNWKLAEADAQKLKASGAVTVIK